MSSRPCDAGPQATWLRALALTGLSVGCLLGCGDRPQQVGAPVEAYLDGLQEPEIRAVRMCWEGCEESESVAPDRWAGLLEAIK